VGSVGRFLLTILWQPFRLLRGLFGLIFGRLIRRLIERFYSSSYFSQFINRISSSMATQRGLLLMVGTVLLVISLVVHAIVIIGIVSTERYDRSLYWLCLPTTLLHLGVLIGFTGAMIATPLGQGYKDK